MKQIQVVLICAIMFLFNSCINTSHNDADSIKLIPFTDKELVGYFDLEGKVQISAQFKEAFLFHDGIARVRNSSGLYGYIGEDGKYIINPQYKEALDFSEGMAGVVLSSKVCEYIDTKGNVVFIADSAFKCSSFKEGLAAFQYGASWGFLDKKGNIKIHPQFSSVSYFSDGLASVKIGEDVGFIDHEGKYVINPQFKYVKDFSDGLACIWEGDKMGCIDNEGKFIIKPQFDAMFNYKNGSFVVKQGDKWGYVDREGKYIINPQFDAAFSFASNGLALVKQGNKWGYIDMEGKYVISPQFDEAISFFNNVAIVGNAKKYSLINDKGACNPNPLFGIYGTYSFYLNHDYNHFEYGFITIKSDNHLQKLRIGGGQYKAEYEKARQDSIAAAQADAMANEAQMEAQIESGYMFNYNGTWNSGDNIFITVTPTVSNSRFNVILQFEDGNTKLTGTLINGKLWCSGEDNFWINPISENCIKAYMGWKFCK